MSGCRGIRRISSRCLTVGDNAGTFADVTQNKQADAGAAFICKTAVLVTVLFVVLKVVKVGETTVSDVYHWSWWAVFSPLWGLALLIAGIVVLQVWANKQKAAQAKRAKAAVLKLATDMTRSN